MKSLSVIFLFVFVATQVQGQVITGKITNHDTDKPLEYVNIGVVGEPVGTISDMQGDFRLDIKGLPNNKEVRFSMIGFESKTYTIGELLDKENNIELAVKVFAIEEVTITPRKKIRKVGTTACSMRSICGWSGTQRGKGHEIGTKIELGDSPVSIKTLHVRLFHQSFDSSLFRLHIRDIADELPQNELLRENIYIVVTRESGWVEFDLRPYNLILSGDIVLTLEWINVFGLNMDKLLKMGKEKRLEPVVLFRSKKGKGSFYSKWGSEAKWIRRTVESPTFYLTVQ